jgi:hypothetical protein
MRVMLAAATGMFGRTRTDVGIGRWPRLLPPHLVSARPLKGSAIVGGQLFQAFASSNFLLQIYRDKLGLEAAFESAKDSRLSFHSGCYL